MKKSELRSIIREVLKEELSKQKLKEAKTNIPYIVHIYDVDDDETYAYLRLQADSDSEAEKRALEFYNTEFGAYMDLFDGYLPLPEDTGGEADACAYAAGEKIPGITSKAIANNYFWLDIDTKAPFEPSPIVK